MLLAIYYGHAQAGAQNADAKKPAEAGLGQDVKKPAEAGLVG